MNVLREVLDVLKERGRIKQIWMPGMRVQYYTGVFGRIIAANERGIQLIEWERSDTEFYARTWNAAAIPEIWTPDIRDPATQGCLRALIIEASPHSGGEEYPEDLPHFMLGLLLQIAAEGGV